MTDSNGDGPTGTADGELFRAVLAFFVDDGWRVTPAEDEPIASLNFQGQSGRWMCYAQTREPQRQFVFYSVCPVMAAEDKRLAMAEFVTRANYGMIIGNFELDMNDGEVRYKTSIDVEGSRLDNALIQSCVYANVLMMDRYLPGILAVLFSGSAPIDALAKVEAGEADEED